MNNEERKGELSLQMYCKTCVGKMRTFGGDFTERTITLICEKCAEEVSIKTIPAIIDALSRMKYDYEQLPEKIIREAS